MTDGRILLIFSLGYVAHFLTTVSLGLTFLNPL